MSSETQRDDVIDLMRETALIKLAITNYAGLAPFDLLKSHEIQRDLAAIAGVPHHHRASIANDQCAICFRDLRDECHIRKALKS